MLSIRGSRNRIQGDRIMASEGNMKSATQTYSGFVSVMKWGTIASVAVAAVVVLLISS